MPAPPTSPKPSSTLYKKRVYYTGKEESYWEKLKKAMAKFGGLESSKYTSEASIARQKMAVDYQKKAAQDKFYQGRQRQWLNWKQKLTAPYGMPGYFDKSPSEAQRAAGWKAAQTAPTSQFKSPGLYARNTYYTPPTPQAGSSLFPGGYTAAQGRALMAAYPNMDSSEQYLMKARGYNRWIEPEVLPYEQKNTQAGYGGSGYGRGGYGRGGYGGGGGYGDGGGYNGYTGYGGGQQQPNYRNYTQMADTPRWLSSLVNWRGPGG